MSNSLRTEQPAKFRFAPSPNGRLHIGHAYSALLNEQMARESGGQLFLRIEDIDQTRCTDALEQAIYEDLKWLGVTWEEPVRRQSEHFDSYQSALKELITLGLVYPTNMSRGEIKSRVKDFEAKGKDWPRDPDGAPIYPSEERAYASQKRLEIINGSKPFAWRLDVCQALQGMGSLSWLEGRDNLTSITADPAIWGDVILSRSDAPSSYHLSVVIDDAVQGITKVVRGKDLFHATSIHRLLQTLLGLPAPTYYHHLLILDQDGRKLSKSIQSTGITELRKSGMTASDIRDLITRQIGSSSFT